MIFNYFSILIILIGFQRSWIVRAIFVFFDLYCIPIFVISVGLTVINGAVVAEVILFAKLAIRIVLIGFFLLILRWPTSWPSYVKMFVFGLLSRFAESKFPKSVPGSASWGSKSGRSPIWRDEGSDAVVFTFAERTARKNATRGSLSCEGSLKYVLRGHKMEQSTLARQFRCVSDSESISMR